MTNATDVIALGACFAYANVILIIYPLSSADGPVGARVGGCRRSIMAILLRSCGGRACLVRPRRQRRRRRDW